MATAKTGSFYLTNRVTLPAATAAGTRITATTDLGAYVNVPTGQAIAIEEVDFIFQGGTDMAGDVIVMLAANGAITAQLSDLNNDNVFVPADDHSLVASGCLNIDQANGIASHSSDFYPDNFGPAKLSEAFMVVNDTLYLTVGNDSADTFAACNVSVRIRCRVVKLGKEDWMAIAIQSTAADN